MFLQPNEGKAEQVLTAETMEFYNYLISIRARVHFSLGKL